MQHALQALTVLVDERALQNQVILLPACHVTKHTWHKLPLVSAACINVSSTWPVSAHRSFGRGVEVLRLTSLRATSPTITTEAGYPPTTCSCVRHAAGAMLLVLLLSAHCKPYPEAMVAPID